MTAVEHRIWQSEEIMPREAITEIQLKRLKETVVRAKHVPFYRDAFEKAGLSEDSIKSLDDLRRFPFTTKVDLRDQYPFGFAAVPREQFARIHGSSGTTGKPTFVPYTKNDLITWADLCARFLVAGGLQKEHVVQVSFGYGLFTGGFGLHYGIERVGASIIPAASGNTPRQLMLLQDLEIDVLIATPSYALNLGESAAAQGIKLSLKYGHFGGEAWTQDMRLRIEEKLGILAFDNYGLSEVIGPGVSGECMLRNGLHVQEDHFIIECVDPQTLEPVAEGEKGELVFTSLTKEAMPIIRYRTRDLAALFSDPCPCGRTHIRMTRVSGRTDDMLIIRGVNVYPTQIEEALLRVDGAEPHYMIEVDREGARDTLKVSVEVRPELFSDEMRRMQALHDRIDRAIHTMTGLRAEIALVAPNTIPRSEGKASRVVDYRRQKGIL